MIGLVFGIACGALEFWLLNLLTAQVVAGGPVALWIVPAKLGGLALFVIPCALFFPAELYLLGIGITGVLLVGSTIQFLRNTQKRQQAEKSANKKKDVS